MKEVKIDKCDISIIECDCGYHLGVDNTYIEQVGHFITKCPSCGTMINTLILEPGIITDREV